MMKTKMNLPVDILSRELYRLNNDIDRLQMLVTLKSHLQNLLLTPQLIQRILSSFNDEKYCLQAIQQLIPYIYMLITSDSLSQIFELFHNHENRLNLIETLKNCELLKDNYEVNEILLHEYRQYFHVKKPIKIFDNPPPITTNSDVIKIPGVFEKAKQFVCRVFGGGGGSSSKKRLIDEVNSSPNNFEPTPLSSQSYTSLVTKSPPPPSPITQIHSILDNIDSVLDKIEAQSTLPTSTIDQITQTTMNFVNDGRGDYFDSLLSSDSSEDEDD